MNKYDCNRCGRQYGSRSAVRMHLRRKHFNKQICDYCGTEVFSKGRKDHILSSHACQRVLPVIYKPIATTKQKIKAAVSPVEEESFWETPCPRLPRFTASGTSLKCRICGVTMGGVHSREQHEKDIHKFTTQVKTSLALRLQSWNMLDFLRSCDVGDYLNKDLKNKLGNTTECNNEVNVLVNFLITELSYDVSHVIRGGSYGKDTCLKGHSDIDLVMFIEGFPLFGGSPASTKRLSACLCDVKIHLQQSLLATRILMSETTSHSLRFQYKCYKNDHIHHVDLLPCNDLLGPNPSLDDKNALYELISNCKSDHELQLLNASLIQLQVEFVRQRPSIVHDLIRMVKHWRRTSFGDKQMRTRYRRLPNSYTLELISIYVWEKQGKPVTFELRRGLAAVLQCLVEYEYLLVVWFENYSKHNKWLHQTLTSQRPIVIDPANPLNNVCESNNTWDEVAYVARESLKKPLFRGLKIKKSSIF